MKYEIETGRGKITLMALLGIWSVSALTSLPGIAVSPILDELSAVFPKATELDVQLLTTLPSLLIIPFVLLAGYISRRVGYIKLLYIGLWLFLLSGALYFVCSSMRQLIVVSALLGVGAGVIIPLSTALVSMFFNGEERSRQFGYVSAITNIALVVATAVVGWLADVQWRLPFLVYLLPAVAVALVPSIRRSGERLNVETLGGGNGQGGSASRKGWVKYGKLWRYMLYYLLITYLVMVVSINLPFLLGEHGYDSGVSGVVISVFFVAMMLPGFFINRIVAVLGRNILVWALLLISIGLLDVFYNHSLLFVIIGCVAAGFGYGMAQPYIYNVTSSLASVGRVAYALALLMSMNYVAIVVSPFVIEWLQESAGVKGERFPFAMNAVIGFVALMLLMLRRVFAKRKSDAYE